jgi:hypothetical protein
VADGPGKYDKLTTWVRERAKAEGVILIVVGGNKGHGFSAQLSATFPAESMLMTVAMLRDVANQIEVDARARQS